VVVVVVDKAEKVDGVEVAVVGTAAPLVEAAVEPWLQAAAASMRTAKVDGRRRDMESRAYPELTCEQTLTYNRRHGPGV
jgi:hypothetical protein